MFAADIQSRQVLAIAITDKGPEAGAGQFSAINAALQCRGFIFQQFQLRFEFLDVCGLCSAGLGLTLHGGI